MTLQRLKWVSIVAPILFIVAIELARRVIFRDLLSGWPGYLLLAGVILIGVLFFSETIFNVIDRTQERLEQTNRELLALHEAGLDITGDLRLDRVLQGVVDEARGLVGARYGALSYLDEQGVIEQFLTSGTEPEQHSTLGPPADSVLGNLAAHAATTDNPDGQPAAQSRLAVPIAAHGVVLGNLYLTEKVGTFEFNQTDGETLARFATQAALAIENARLHHQVRELAVAEERERIAREIHDSVAQVLGYVNTKAQAAGALLDAGEIERATVQVGQLGQAARDAYADVREHILGLRATGDADRPFVETLRLYLETWQQQSGIRVALVIDPSDRFEASLPETGELQLLRIIQEALANVRKHAGATHATVALGLGTGWVEARITDDGQGFDPVASARGATPRFGLTTMRERAEAVGGLLTIETNAGEGTTVEVKLPMGARRGETVRRGEH
ncbi:MAG TPA: histidine kinase [Chloroflexi bacterium]|jgi:nitrate/nitrite-specific signal transduction histidine kinase|nr:histidine kinase [Chloroflexota bacterium]HBY44863.1 histidine kinase [Chloroflexota bacterium]HCG29991.1 histidine kinase [Chloroflexota bacterium]HRA31424.1 histidine kinase [Thermomicrobiales bacterium]